MIEKPANSSVPHLSGRSFHDKVDGLNDGGLRARRIEVFGFDVAEISQIRRIRAMTALGHDVHSFTMRRNNMNAGFEADWPNTHLFRTENDRLIKRALIVAASVAKMIWHRTRIRQADMIFARNLDMLAIAWAARVLSGAAHVPLIYECLDINGALCRYDRLSRMMRAAERFLLARIQMLVVSSPGFIDHYFVPMQGYHGHWALWENKLAAGLKLPNRPVHRKPRAPDAALTIGWVGTIRCAPSLKLLTELAERMGPRVAIHLHGIVHGHVKSDFEAALDTHANISFFGAYSYPLDLAKVYGDCDLVWAQDLWQSGNNSDWLLPNRLYEASWAGCPSLAVAGTATAGRVVADGLGWVVDKPEVEAVISVLQGLTADQIAAKSRDLLARPDEDFVQALSDIQYVIDLVSANKQK